VSDEQIKLRIIIARTMALAVLAALAFGAIAIVSFTLHAWVLAILMTISSIGYAVAFYKLIPRALRDWNI